MVYAKLHPNIEIAEAAQIAITAGTLIPLANFPVGSWHPEIEDETHGSPLSPLLDGRDAVGFYMLADELDYVVHGGAGLEDAGDADFL